jgi:hypothetical protein
MTKKYNEAQQMVFELNKQLHNRMDPLYWRMQWRKSGERLVSELGRVAANMPAEWVRNETFEDYDWNLANDITTRMRALLNSLNSFVIADYLDGAPTTPPKERES